MTSADVLTQQFYEWERRGRGWQVWPFPVALEPPFRPFHGYNLSPSGQVRDDARQAPIWEQSIRLLAKGALGAVRLVRRKPAVVPKPEEPQQGAFLDEADLVELRLCVPPNMFVGEELTLRLFQALGHSATPKSFELLADSEQVAVQFACHQSEAPHLLQQLRAHFPDLGVQVQQDSLHDWAGSSEHAWVIEFGLAREFMLPLVLLGSSKFDALAPIVATLSHLDPDQRALVQVLFQPTRKPWAQSATRALVTRTGKPFFQDAPHLTTRAASKFDSPLFSVVLRVAAVADNSDACFEVIRNIARGLAPLCDPNGNQLVPLDDEGLPLSLQLENLSLRQSHRSGMLLSARELASLVHIPGPTVRSEKLQRQVRQSRRAPSTVAGHSLRLGTNEHAGVLTDVTLSTKQRLRHTYVIGASGTGKSTLLLSMALQDIEAGRGCGVLDPHGDLVDELLGRIPEERHKDVVLLDPSDPDYAVGFNVLSAHSDLERQLLSSDLVAVFRRLSTSWGDQMTSVLANAVIAFLESSEGGTLSDLRRFLVDKDFRKRFLTTVTDPEIVYFWEKEFTLLAGRPQAPLLTRLDAFLRPRLIRHMVAQKESKIDFRAVMDGSKIFLARLSQGAIGEENAHLLGALLVSKLQQTAQSRQDTPEADRAPFFLYLDEFQHFITPSMATVLSGARKYGLGLTLAHQDLSQFGRSDSKVMGAAISNPATRICFRVGDMDARKLAEGFAHFDAGDLQSLGVGQAICRVDQAQHDFNLETKPLERVSVDGLSARRDAILTLTQTKFGTPRTEVEETLRKAYAPQDTPRVAREDPAPAVVDRQDDAAKEPQKADPTGDVNELEQPKLVVAPAPVAPQEVEAHPAQAPTGPPAPGRGGKQHQYLQQLIKGWGEQAGYKSTVESPTPSGDGSVDVLLEKDGKSIAVEVSSTTSAGHELQNIRKCLAAGYDLVAAVSPHTRKTNALRKLAKIELSAADLRSVRFWSPEELLEQLADHNTDEQIVKGYRVSVTRIEVEDDKKLRAQMKAVRKAMEDST